MIEEEIISQEPVQQPPYNKKVFDILSSNFTDCKLGEQDFYKKLATDKNYAGKVHDVLIQNFSDFKKPKNEFIDSLTFEEPLKKKDGGEVSSPTKLPSKSQEYLDKGQGLVDNSFLKQIGQLDPSQLISQYKSPDISLTQKPKKDYYDTKLEKGLVFDKEGELYTPSSEALSKPITKAEEASLKKSTQKDLVEQAREMPIQEPTKEGEWANVVQNVAANFELAGTKLAEGAAALVRDFQSLQYAGVDNRDLYDSEGRKTKYTESASWMNDPLGKVILGLEGNKHRMQDVIKNNPLPSTFWGNAVSEVASFAPDIAATALLPEAKLAEGASVLKVIGANLINNFTKYMTVKGGVEGYGEARVSGKNIGKSVVEGGKGAVTGFQTGIEMAVLGAGSNLATKKIMQKAEKIGLTGVKGLTAKELVNLGTDVTAFGLLSPTAHAALEGRWVTAEEIASGTGIAALFRLKGAVENIKSNRELNKSLQETQELKQGVAISNFVDADPAAIERVYYTKESADELQLKALEAAKNAKETTDLQKKQQYIAEVMAYSKAANVKQVTEDIINNKDALRKFQESDLPDNIKQAFLEKAGEIIKQLDPLEQKKTLLGQDIVDTNNFIKESTDALNIESDPVKKMELQVSIEDAEKLLKDNEIELKKIIKEQNQPKQEEDLLTEDGIKNAQKEFNKNIDQQIKDLDKNNPDYKLAAEQYQTTMKKYAAQTSGLISDPEQRAYFQLDADNDFARGSSDINDYVRSKQIDAGRGQYITLKDGNLNGAINATSEGDSIAFINTQNALIDGAVTSGYMDAESAAKERITIPQEVALGRYNNLSSTEKLEVINSRKTKPDPNNKHVEGAVINPTDVINATLDIEGGYSASDGASGAPVIFGINQKYHPEAFLAAKTINDTEGPEAGKEYARNFYKKEYYDKYDLGKYTPDVQKVLFDGVINHRVKFNEQLINAADKGATAKDLISMRREEYQRLGKNEAYAPSLQGWMNRLSEVERNVGGPFGGASATYEKKGDIYDYIPADKWVEMEKQAVADARVESKLASEENILKQIENQNTFMDLISAPSHPS